MHSHAVLTGAILALVCAATSLPARADQGPSQKSKETAQRAAAKASATPATVERVPANQTISAAQREKTARQVTGHSIQDIQNMSDAQLDALESALKRQYGH